GTGNDLALELNYATKADGAYPITLVTYEIVCDKGNKSDTLAATKSFLTYTASKDGQDALAALGYAPIPAEINAKVQKAVASIS
ncbi:phosphate ABC transporter substrate-binding protein PstS, partial [Streptomyces sp. VRA16 Mangrove soil]|nr:phosphate ABC transporter substrate-binding protein PstS [Streptomyces sp. VRA16 Mangrove soil]